MNDKKRFYRELKKSIKKDGNRQRRNFLKKALLENPTEAHWDEFQFGYTSSEWLNGMDQEDRHETESPVSLQQVQD